MHFSKLPLYALFLIFPVLIQAQLFEYPLQERIQDAAWIVEGQVIHQECFKERGKIFTINEIALFKVFGEIPDHNEQIIKLVTEGGIVGDEMMVVEPSLQLSPFETGIFFIQNKTAKGYKIIGGPQGFVKYNPFDHSAHDVFRKYSSIENELYSRIMQVRNTDYYKEFRERQQTQSSIEIREISTVTNFTPSTITAGTNDTLTINGSGFGAAFVNQAAVLFANANDGGSTFTLVDTSGTLAVYMVSWADNQIKVIVPKRAGSGIIGVRTSTGTTFFSASSLNIPFSQSDVVFGGMVNEPHLYDHNGTGGYTFLYSTSTANGGVAIALDDSAMARIDESLAEWKCATGINWSAVRTTTIDSSASDGFNVISYDNDLNTTLPNGVLGTAYGFFGYCSTNQEWFKTGMDLILRRDGTGGTNWYYQLDPNGIMAGETDFKSVVLHELGHAHGLGHIINSGALMHYALLVGSTIRNFDAISDVGGGSYIMGHSMNYTPECGVSLMVAEACSIPPVAKFSADTGFYCQVNSQIAFTDLSTASPTSWRWFFGDGDSSHLQNPQHSYSYPGCYTVKLISTNSFGSDTLVKLDYITVMNGLALSSMGGTTSNLANNFGLGIYNFTFNGVSYSSGGAVFDAINGAPTGYLDWSCWNAAKACLDTTYTYSVTVGGLNPEDIHIYIDFNGDGDFDDVNEMVHEENQFTGMFNGNFTIFNNTQIDSLLRIRIISDFHQFNISGPNYNPIYGQVEDYSLIVNDCSGRSTWTGKQNEIYSNAANWSPSRVPGTIHDVIIPVAVPNFPKVYSNCEPIKSLIIETGAQMTITVNGKLEVNE